MIWMNYLPNRLLRSANHAIHWEFNPVWAFTFSLVPHKPSKGNSCGIAEANPVHSHRKAEKDAINGLFISIVIRRDQQFNTHKL